MKRLLIAILLLAAPSIVFAQGISQLNQWKTGGANYVQPINNAYGLLVPGLATSTNGCLSVSSTGWISASGSACGSGGGSAFAFPFTARSYGNSTSTTLGLLNGLLSTASSTFNSSLFFTNLPAGFLYTGTNGLTSAVASSSIKLSWFNNDAGFITSAVTSVGATWPIISSGGATPTISFGGLGTTTNLTQGQIPYVTGVNTFGQVPTTTASCSGSTSCSSFTIFGSSPVTISSSATASGLATTSPISGGNILEYTTTGAGSAFGIGTTSLGVTGPITFSGTLGAQIGGVAGNFDCTTATASVKGCLASTDFNTFNNKIGWGQATTSPWSADQFVYLNHSGLMVTAASSSLNLPNSALTNSSVTINTNSPLGGGGAVSLGGNLTLTCASCATYSYLFPNNDTNFGNNANATSSVVGFTGGILASSTSQFANATSTLFTAGTFWNSGITSALVSVDANHKEGAYGGASACSSHNFVTTISASGGTTCGTDSITVNGTVFNFGDSKTITAASSTLFTDINKWTALQNLAGGASTTGEISMGTASSTNLVVSGIRSALHLAAADGTVSAYGGSNPCSNQVALSISASGVISCTSVTDAMFSGTLTVAHGGTGASNIGKLQLLATDSSGNVISTSTPTANSFFATSTTLASQFPYASTTMVTATTASTSALTISGIGSGATKCLQADANGIISEAASACGGSSSTPGGANTNIQFNRNSTFAGNSDLTFTFDGHNSVLKVSTTSNSVAVNVSRSADLNQAELILNSGSSFNDIFTQDNGTYIQSLDNGTGGSIFLNATQGTISVQHATANGASGVLDFSSVTTANKTFTYPNETGTLTLGTGSAGNCAQWSDTNTLTVTSSACGTATFAWPWTLANVFGTANANSTSTLQQLTAGLAASSTVRFGNAGVSTQFLWDSVIGALGIGTSTPRWVTQFASSTAPQITLTDNTAGNTSHWSFWNELGNLWLSTSSPTTFATSTWSIPYRGFIEFPSTGGCVGCTDIHLPYGIDLRAAKFVAATSTQFTASTTQDIYTAPTGRRALLLGCNYVNQTATNVNFKQYVKIGGTKYMLSGTTSVATLVGQSTKLQIILEPGDALSILDDTTTGAAWARCSFIEYDASVPLKSVRALAPTSGTSTLYTVPTGATADFLSSDFNGGASGALTSQINICTDGGSTVTAKGYIVPSDEVATDKLNSMIPAGATLNNGSPTAITLVGAAGTANQATLNPGWFLAYNLSASTGGDCIAWANIFEH